MLALCVSDLWSSACSWQEAFQSSGLSWSFSSCAGQVQDVSQASTDPLCQISQNSGSPPWLPSPPPAAVERRRDNPQVLPQPPPLLLLVLTSGEVFWKLCFYDSES